MSVKLQALPAVKGAVCQCTESSPTPPRFEPCKHSGLIVECSHDRSIEIDAKTPISDRFLEVVAGPAKMPDKITCKTTLLEGPCREKKFAHKDHVFDIYSNPIKNLKIDAKTDTQAKFQTVSVPMDVVKNPLRYLWPASAAVNSYIINTETCYGKRPQPNCEVIVYPDVSWSAEFQLEHLESDKKGESSKEYIGKKKGYSNETSDDGLKFTGSIKVSSDGKETAVSGEWENQLKRVFTTINSASRAFQKLQSQFQSCSPAKLEWKRLPSFSLEGAWGWEEVQGSNKCGFKVKAAVKVVIVEADLKIDVIKVILQYLSAGAGVALSDLLDKAKKKGAELSAELNVNGKVSMEGEWEGTAAQNLDVSAGQASASGIATLDVSLESTIEIDLEVWILKIGGAASFGAKTGFEFDVKAMVEARNLVLNSELKWTGVSVTASYKSPTFELSKKSKKKMKKGSTSATHQQEGALESDWTFELIPEQSLLSGKIVLVENI